MLLVFYLKNAKILPNLQKFCENCGKFLTKNEILEQCKGGHCVDLGESFQTHIYLQNFVSIQPRTSPVKFAASRDGMPSLPPGTTHTTLLPPRAQPESSGLHRLDGVSALGAEAAARAPRRAAGPSGLNVRNPDAVDV